MITQLSPVLVWKYFAALSQIPRPSKHEAAARLYCQAWAHSQGLYTETDQIGNLRIDKPATPGYEHCSGVILQAHLDMVCQKRPHSAHDFLRDPLKLQQIDSQWIQATDTTLGADNGIGVAAALAILEDPQVQHPPLQVLLTVDEEAGMGGVRQLAPNWLHGDYLINLDGEEWGSAYIGCAGGVDMVCTATLAFHAAAKDHVYRVDISGLKGGHSGLDIDQGRGNANVILAELLSAFSQNHTLCLHHFVGGTLRNALTREAYAIISVDDKHAWQQFFKISQAEIIQRFAVSDANLKLTMQALTADERQYLTIEQSRHFLALLSHFPHGVLEYNLEKALVETSANIGVVKLIPEEPINIVILARALKTTALTRLITEVNAQVDGSEYTVTANNAYPAWTPNDQANIVKILSSVYHAYTKQTLQIKVIHAGLETGLIGQHYPHLEMISFGPTIINPHSPDEKVNIPSVNDFYAVLCGLLLRLSVK